MNLYEAKQQTRKDRLVHRAERAERTSNSLYKQSRELAEVIPLGQPILVGHHSERRDRILHVRIAARFHRACSEARKAAHFKRRAAAVGTAGISSDDPDALTKLRADLVKRTAEHDRRKRANALLRRKDPGALGDLGFTQREIAILAKGDELGRIGFTDYEIKNGAASITRIAARIKELEKALDQPTKEQSGEGYIYREDVTENRVMFCFDDKPSAEIRAILKANGFRSSSRRDAWVRHLNDGGRCAAKRVRDQMLAIA